MADLKLALGIAFFAAMGSLMCWFGLRGLWLGDFRGSVVPASRRSNPITYWALAIAVNVGGTLMVFLAINALAHFRAIESLPVTPRPWPKITTFDGMSKALTFAVGLIAGLTWMIFPRTYSRVNWWHSALALWLVRIGAAALAAASGWGLARFFSS